MPLNYLIEWGKLQIRNKNVLLLGLKLELPPLAIKENQISSTKKKAVLSDFK